jgi:hypothetical protein
MAEEGRHVVASFVIIVVFLSAAALSSTHGTDEDINF